ncbi:BA75_04562T0 [Komagataella pastoris]|uniref:BA75_04562T0 n=1 Tax=Komagataella pastoris TaxID=4922 RepID=A0A1B2JIU7_PICPA|nr:BA75_04562T0 [Komagataella pastoris]
MNRASCFSLLQYVRASYIRSPITLLASRQLSTRIYKKMPENKVTSVFSDSGVTLPLSDPHHVNVDALSLFSLKGKVASITGSSAGIGLAVAEAYAQAGADVAIWYNSTPVAEKVKEISTKYGVRCRAYKCSVGDFSAVKSTIEQQIEDFGKIDIFVANAGVAWSSGAILDLPHEEAIAEWEKVFKLDVDAVFYCAKVIGEYFREHKKGSFIITASMSGHVVNYPQLQAPYNAAKAAVLQFSKSLAVEWSEFARVNTVSPGYIKTELTKFADVELRQKWWSIIPQGREGLPQELVGAYIYLASDASSYTTGADIRVDGGYTAP